MLVGVLSLSCFSMLCHINTPTTVLFPPVLVLVVSKKKTFSMTCCFLLQLEALYIPAQLLELVEKVKTRRKHTQKIYSDTPSNEISA